MVLCSPVGAVVTPAMRGRAGYVGFADMALAGILDRLGPAAAAALPILDGPVAAPVGKILEAKPDDTDDCGKNDPFPHHGQILTVQIAGCATRCPVPR